MLLLPQVTLVAVSSVDIKGALFALSISSSQIEFGEVKFLTSAPIIPNNEKIKVEQIQELDLLGYSKFILQDLHRYVNTPYCLVVQADGFVINPHCWQKQFLDFDYIGAPWPSGLVLQPGNIPLKISNRVGNGGFSLRSKKLLIETSKIDFDSLNVPCFSEDLIICHFLYDQMLSAGIAFPEPELAASFSIEIPEAWFGQTPNTAFGFHGKELRDAIVSNFIAG